MSRVGKLPVAIPQGVEVAVAGDVVNVKGTGGAMSLQRHALVQIESKDGQITFSPADESLARCVSSSTTWLLA